MTLIDVRQKSSSIGFGTRRRSLPYPDGNFIDEFDKKTLLWAFGGLTSAIGRPTSICTHNVTMQTIETQNTPFQITETHDTPIQTMITINDITIPC